MQDLLKVDALLSEQERLIRDSVRRFVAAEVIPQMPDCFEQGRFPKEFIQKTAELGLLGMSLPEKFGGSAANATTYGLVCQELEYGDSGLRSFVSVQSSLCMFPIFKFGNDAQRKKFLLDMAAGKCIGCFGLTEPDAGSDPGSMKTTAKKTDKGWVLNGAKMWITNATIADIAIVWAKTDDGIRGFIVEKDFKGFSTHEIKHKMSLRASYTGELILDDCLVPDENLLPGSDVGLKAPLSCLSQARFGICWGVIGAAMSCLDATLEYTVERKQFNKSIASTQMVQKDLADIYVEILKAQSLNLQLARLKDQNELHPAAISAAKMNNCREALKAARVCRNLLGASGISLEYPVIRHMLNLESVFTYEGTDNIHHLVLGKYLTGFDAF